MPEYALALRRQRAGVPDQNEGCVSAHVADAGTGTQISCCSQNPAVLQNVVLADARAGRGQGGKQINRAELALMADDFGSKAALWRGWESYRNS